MRHKGWDKSWDKRDKLKKLSLKISTIGTSGTRVFELVPQLVLAETLDSAVFSPYWDKWDKKLPIEGLKIEIRDPRHTFGRLNACVPIYAREVVPLVPGTECTMRERDVERALTREVQAAGGLCWKFTSPGTVGVPDRIVILPEGRIGYTPVAPIVFGRRMKREGVENKVGHRARFYVGLSLPDDSLQEALDA